MFLCVSDVIVADFLGPLRSKQQPPVMIVGIGNNL